MTCIPSQEQQPVTPPEDEADDLWAAYLAHVARCRLCGATYHCPAAVKLITKVRKARDAIGWGLV